MYGRRPASRGDSGQPATGESRTDTEPEKKRDEGETVVEEGSAPECLDCQATLAMTTLARGWPLCHDGPLRKFPVAMDVMGGVTDEDVTDPVAESCSKPTVA